ncbi:MULTISPECIES: hypothetical protein [unclassified Brucella]|uniref:hypothetical protein n=1 Tax=unclassified Brucella TaxID=2632610 RepID=UPI00217D5E9E|nr:MULTISPECIES: hypothetical protein [unclassified Brucella]UWF68267.1 hypothetical protein NYO63_10900 [Brucella sp. 1315]UWF71384.1 hypothetical protein NYO65_10895 [Brucella sp. 2594]
MLAAHNTQKTKPAAAFDVLIELNMRSLRYWVRFQFLKQPLYDIAFLLAFFANVAFCFPIVAQANAA